MAGRKIRTQSRNRHEVCAEEEEEERGGENAEKGLRGGVRESNLKGVGERDIAFPPSAFLGSSVD